MLPLGIRVLGTGHSFPDAGRGWDYFTTVQFADGALVFHFFTRWGAREGTDVGDRNRNS